MLRVLCVAALLAGPSFAAQSISLKPSAMPRVGTIDERFQSYNVEMVEITGGRFWRPYSAETDALLAEMATKKSSGIEGGVGMNPALFQYRSPIDLSNPKLRKLASALSPAYIRVSGTWQNSTYFQNSDATAPAKPPKGFNGVLTRAQWKGVIDFSKAVDAKLISSFSTSAGTRDDAGVWNSDMAKQWLAYTKSIGGSIAAAEYMNEPSFPSAAGAPAGYDGPAYARDVKIWRAMMQKDSPQTKLLGPGSVGEGVSLGLGPMTIKMLPSEEMLQATGPVFDAFSYHFYGGVSRRCTAALGPDKGLKAEHALDAEWFSRTDQVADFYNAMRDKYMPGKKLWLTETGEAACGGDKWASTFTDTFRYLNQLGTLAKKGVQVIAQNTLASSDYGLLDESTLEPRPNYWAAVMWRKFMGTTVLDAGHSPDGLYLYAHCLRGTPGGVALLAISTGSAEVQLEVPEASQRYTMSAPSLDSKEVMLNGNVLKLGSGDSLPVFSPVTEKAGKISIAPRTVTFLTVARANNASCKPVH